MHPGIDSRTGLRWGQIILCRWTGHTTQVAL